MLHTICIEMKNLDILVSNRPFNITKIVKLKLWINELCGGFTCLDLLCGMKRLKPRPSDEIMNLSGYTQWSFKRHGEIESKKETKTYFRNKENLDQEVLCSPSLWVIKYFYFVFFSGNLKKTSAKYSFALFWICYLLRVLNH